jgi:HSP20 family protein
MNLIRFNQHPLFSGILNDVENEFTKTEGNCNGNYPAVNIQEEEKQFTLELAAPGLKKDDFKINLENHLLTISKEKAENKEEEKNNFTRKEFAYNSFSRSFKLPKIILENNIKADYVDGILRITLPKDEKVVLTREISVN